MKQKSVRFSRPSGFRQELESRVERYFTEKRLSPRDNVGMYIKAVIILTVFTLSYISLVFYSTSLIMIGASAVLFGASHLGIGLGIQHDGAHKAVSRHAWINRLAAMTLDLVGNSSHVWNWQHNISHHRFTNLPGYDGDVMFSPLIRLTTQAPQRRYHKYQQWYAWALYGFAHLSFLVGDFIKIARQKKTGPMTPFPKGFDLVWFVSSKGLYWGLMFVLPVFYHPWWAVALVYVSVSVTIGWIYAVIAQAAHMSDIVKHPTVSDGQIGEDWAVHQIRTTSDFAIHNRFLCWLVGGLNCQTVHHLNVRVCHVHYPALTVILKQLCEERGITYNEHRTLFAAIRSHFRYLRFMGTAD